MLTDIQKKRSPAAYVAVVLWIILVLAGYWMMGQLLLHRNWGMQVISGAGAYVFSLCRKMLQLVYLLLILSVCGRRNIIRFEWGRFVWGMKYAWPLFFCYLACLVWGLVLFASAKERAAVSIIFAMFLYFFAGTALTEELLFRGIIQKKLDDFCSRGRAGTWNPAVIWQAVFFAAMHGWGLLQNRQYLRGAGQMAGAFVGGLLYGVIYDRSKSIWTVIFLHGLYDFSVMLVSLHFGS